jgi:glycosyltransferase involved in cell wall biosynthesis
MATPRTVSVLFVLPSLHGGGAERVILTILRHLDRRRFAASLAVIDGRDPIFAADLPTNIDVIDLGFTRVRYSAASLTHLIWKRRPDIVFCVLGHLNLLLALIKPCLPRATRIIARETIVMSSYLVDNRSAWLWKAAYRWLLPRCDAIVCQSQDMKDSLVNDLGISGKNMVVVQNPVDIARVRALSDAPVEHGILRDCSDDSSRIIHLVAAGRLVWQKGFDLLIEAIALLKNPSIHVSILGKGPLRIDLGNLAQQRGVARQIHFLGFQSNPYPLFKRADAFVLSSRFEGMPNVILEALACGTGVIAMPAPGGIDELLRGRPRCLVAKSVSAHGLAEALRDYDFANQGGSAQFALDDYTVENVCRRYAEVFLAVADHPS